MRDKYNLNTLPASANNETDEVESEANAVPMIPGMAPEDRVDIPGIIWTIFREINNVLYQILREILGILDAKNCHFNSFRGYQL